MYKKEYRRSDIDCVTMSSIIYKSTYIFMMYILFNRLDSQEHCEKAIDGLNGTLLPGMYQYMYACIVNYM